MQVQIINAFIQLHNEQAQHVLRDDAGMQRRFLLHRTHIIQHALQR